MERSSIAFLTEVTLRLNSLNPKRKGKQRSMWMKQTLFAQKNSQVSQPIIFQTTAKPWAVIYIYIWMRPSWLKWTASDMNYAYMNMVSVGLHCGPLFFFLKKKEMVEFGCLQLIKLKLYSVKTYSQVCNAIAFLL